LLTNTNRKKGGAGMRSIAFLTQKGGTGKTTLAASVAVAAAESGENVIALDLDDQASLTRWGERRATLNAASKIIVEPLERDRIPRLRSILEGLSAVGFTFAVIDTAGADVATVRIVTEIADYCLLPARPARLDVDATAATFRVAFLANRRAAFVFNQCPPTYRSSRASAAAKSLTGLGVLAEPMLSARMDYQDAIAAGLGVTEYGRGGRAAHEIEALWRWIRTQLQVGPQELRSGNQPSRQAAA
jgi:chromosome partitioning protein